MDDCCYSFDDRRAKSHDWKDGKISGAVYRELTDFRGFRPRIDYKRRWWTGHDRHRIRTLLRFYVSNHSGDGSRSRVHVFEVDDPLSWHHRMFNNPVVAFLDSCVEWLSSKLNFHLLGSEATIKVFEAPETLQAESRASSDCPNV